MEVFYNCYDLERIIKEWLRDKGQFASEIVFQGIENKNDHFIKVRSSRLDDPQSKKEEFVSWARDTYGEEIARECEEICRQGDLLSPLSILNQAFRNLHRNPCEAAQAMAGRPWLPGCES